MKPLILIALYLNSFAELIFLCLFVQLPAWAKIADAWVIGIDEFNTDNSPEIIKLITFVWSEILDIFSTENIWDICLEK